MKEKLFEHSDKFTEYICKCGRPCLVNRQKNIYRCKYCLDNTEPCEVSTGYASKIFAQELDAMGVGMRRMTKPYQYERYASADEEKQ